MQTAHRIHAAKEHRVGSPSGVTTLALPQKPAVEVRSDGALKLRAGLPATGPVMCWLACDGLCSCVMA